MRRGSTTVPSGSLMKPVAPAMRDVSFAFDSRSRSPELPLTTPTDDGQGDSEGKTLTRNFVRPSAINNTVHSRASFGPGSPTARGRSDESRSRTSSGGGREGAASQTIARLSAMAKVVSSRTIGLLSPSARGGGNSATMSPAMDTKDRVGDCREHKVPHSPPYPTDTSVHDSATAGIGSPSARDGFEISVTQPTRMNPNQFMHARGQEDTRVSAGREENTTRALQRRGQTSFSSRVSRPHPAASPATAADVEGVRSAFSSPPHVRDTGGKWDDSDDTATRHVQEATTQSAVCTAAVAATASGGSSGSRKSGDTSPPRLTPGSPDARKGDAARSDRGLVRVNAQSAAQSAVRTATVIATSSGGSSGSGQSGDTPPPRLTPGSPGVRAGGAAWPGQGLVRAKARQWSTANNTSTRSGGERRGSISARIQMKPTGSPGAKGEGSPPPPPPPEIQEQRRRRSIHQHQHAPSAAHRRSSVRLAAWVASGAAGVKDIASSVAAPLGSPGARDVGMGVGSSADYAGGGGVYTLPASEHTVMPDIGSPRARGTVAM